MPRRLSLALAVLLVSATAAPAADRNPAAGRIIAQRDCGVCHAIALTGTSPLQDAPPFREMRRVITTPRLTAMLADRMEVGHPRMPRLRLDPDEIAHLLAYWETLPGPQQAALDRRGPAAR